jgi:tetratricopeptide (TPR) repeat protein
MDYYDLMSFFNKFHFVVALAWAFAANAQTPEIKSVTPVSSAMDSELFYQLLLGEMNVREGEPGAGYSLILDAARKTNDARLYQRAVDIALQARSGESALLAARAWKQAIPASKDANRYVLQILIGLNRINEVVDPLKREVSTTDAKERASIILGLPRYFTRYSDKTLAASAVEQSLAEYLSSPVYGPSAWATIGRLRLEAGDIHGAVDAARKGQAQDLRSEAPVLLALTLLNLKIPAADGIVKKHIEGKATTEIRMEYARVLLEMQRYAEASAQLQIITTEKPDFSEPWLLRGALELQDKKPLAAERSLRRYVELALSKRNNLNKTDVNRGLVQAYLSLAQIAEQKKDFPEAEMWLSRIENAEDTLNAQLRRAAILAKQGKVDEARKLIRSQADNSPADSRLKMTAEVQLLRDSKLYKEAYALLAESTLRNPDDIELVYDMAMMAEKNGNLEEMERLLRRIISEKPSYQHAYNALGYSFAERNIRLPEARLLVLKALEFAPDDPFITDSLGWVEFRSGNLNDALRILQGAFKAKRDAEIAAHLGEVLWTMGRRDQAITIWKEGFQLHNENETLQETLKRLRVKL